MAQNDHNTSWKIFTAAPSAFSVSWKIENHNDFLVEWNISSIVAIDFPVEWQRVGGDGHDVEWGIRDIVNFSTAWKIVEGIDPVVEWKIEGRNNYETEWLIGTEYVDFSVEWKVKIITDFIDTEWIIFNGSANGVEWVIDGVTRHCDDYLVDWSIIAVRIIDNYVVSDYLGRKNLADFKDISKIIYENKGPTDIDNLSLAEILNNYIG